jgi:hypothetical protein
MVVSYLVFALLLIKPSLKFAFISGIFVGLSFLTKMPSQILAPLIVLLAVIGYIGHRDWRFWLKALVLCGLTSAVIFILLWPAMWVTPSETLKMMYMDTFEVGDIGGKDKVEFFMGVIRERQSQLFYPLALLFRLTPLNLIGAVITLVFVFLSLITQHTDKIYHAKTQRSPSYLNFSFIFAPLRVLREVILTKVDGMSSNGFFSKDSQIRRMVWLLWLFVIVVIVLANISPKKADRYALSVVLAIDLLAGVGWVWLVERISKLRIANRRIANNQFKIHNSKFKIQNLVTIVLIATQLLFVVASYPYVLTYYNPLLGGYATAVELVPVGWGEGLEEAAAWINRQPDAATATVSPYYENVTNPYLVGKSLDWSNDGKKQVQADYVVFYIAQTQRKLPYPGLVDYFEAKEPVHVIRQGQTPYIWIYKRETPLRQLAGEAEIVGRAQIVGYDMSTPDLAPGSSTDITLYLLTFDQQLPANEDFEVSLVDAGGNNYGDWQSAANNIWTPHSVVEWRGQLSPPQDFTPGEYKLKVSLVDTNAKTEVTHFPFADEIITVNPQRR